VLYTITTPLAPKPQPSAPSRPPNSNNNRNKNNNHRNGGNSGGNDGRNDISGGTRGGNSVNTIVTSTSSTRNDGNATSPWPTYVNPWQGHIAMYIKALAASGHYTPLGFMPE
jgi:hypothetical protein